MCLRLLQRRANLLRAAPVLAHSADLVLRSHGAASIGRGLVIRKAALRTRRCLLFVEGILRVKLVSNGPRVHSTVYTTSGLHQVTVALQQVQEACIRCPVKLLTASLFMPPTYADDDSQPPPITPDMYANQVDDDDDQPPALPAEAYGDPNDGGSDDDAQPPDEWDDEYESPPPPPPRR